MYIGAAYYPEHWNEERWEQDAILMKEAHFNVIRIAEFAWCKIEPHEGVFDFLWLDKVVSLFQKYGIGVVMCTPTAAPPKWLCNKYDFYPRDECGHTRGFGSRRHCCYNNEDYIRHSRIVVEKMAQHFAKHENIVAWQIDNEFGVHSTIRCYCDNCQSKFREWLKEHYSDIETLNKAMGTIFWSQCYNDFHEVDLPRHTVVSAECTNPHNPSLALSFDRFSSDSAIRYLNMQVEILRNNVSVPITNNLMGHFDQVDYFKLAKEIDFVCWDNYPGVADGDSNYVNSMAHDLMYGLKQKPIWVMEQKSGPCGWNTISTTPNPGQLMLWTDQAVAHSAEGIVYFRWRACLFGTEMYWYGVLDHDGKPRRRYYELKETAQRLHKLEPVLKNSKRKTDIGIIKCYSNLWSNQLQNHNPEFNYTWFQILFYTAVQKNRKQTEIISLDSDFNAYKMIIIPALNILTRETAEKIRNYVQGGGKVIVTFRSGTKDENNNMTELTLPGYFSDMCGLELEEFDSIVKDNPTIVSGMFGDGYTAKCWCDVIRTSTAETIASYQNKFYSGKPAVTKNQYGKGVAYYVGCDLDDEGLYQLIGYILDKEHLKDSIFECKDNVEIVCREGDDMVYYSVMNFSNEKTSIHFDGVLQDLLNGEVYRDSMELEPYASMWLQLLES